MTTLALDHSHSSLGATSLDPLSPNTAP
jgi:hypothetical protein